MPSVTITKVQKDPSGHVRFRFGKREREFPSLAEAREFVRGVLGDPDTIEAAAIALMLSRQPSLGNPAVFQGRSVIIDFSLPSWGTIV